MPRYIDAHFAQLIADAELGSSDKETVYWVLAHTPTADVQEVIHAKFELVNNGKGVCSNCHRLDSIDKLAKYCRYCGAKIKKEKLK